MISKVGLGCQMLQSVEKIAEHRDPFKKLLEMENDLFEMYNTSPTGFLFTRLVIVLFCDGYNVLLIHSAPNEMYAFWGENGDQPTQRDKPSHFSEKTEDMPTQRDKPSHLGVIKRRQQVSLIYIISILVYLIL
ncbi:hypothetical protein TNCV_5053911 [Trichonephila clavipes]|nr:hypothetical protein TNCV_5053911 [Trichonephila clavipes]